MSACGCTTLRTREQGAGSNRPQRRRCTTRRSRDPPARYWRTARSTRAALLCTSVDDCQNTLPENLFHNQNTRQSLKIMLTFEAFVAGAIWDIERNGSWLAPRWRRSSVKRRAPLGQRPPVSGTRNLAGKEPSGPARSEGPFFTSKWGRSESSQAGSQAGAGRQKFLNKSERVPEPLEDPLFESLLGPEPAEKRSKHKSSKKQSVDRLVRGKQKYFFEGAVSETEAYNMFANLLESESLTQYAARAEVEWFDAKRLEAASKNRRGFPSVGEIQDLLYDELIDTDGKRWRETVVPSDNRVLLVLFQVSPIDVEFPRYLEHFHAALNLTPTDAIHLIAVSREKPSTNRKTMRKLNLRFPLLSDEQGALGALFGTGNKPHMLIFYREKTPSGIEGWFFDRCARAELPSKLLENTVDYARKLVAQRLQASMRAKQNPTSTGARAAGTDSVANTGMQPVPPGPGASRSPQAAGAQATSTSTAGAAAPERRIGQNPPAAGRTELQQQQQQQQQSGASASTPTAAERLSAASKAVPLADRTSSTPAAAGRGTVSKNEARARLVLNHSTHLEGLISVLERLAVYESIRKIVPGRLYTARSNAERLSIRVTVPVAGGWKLVARKGTQVQDVFVTLESPSSAYAVAHQRSILSKEQLQRLVDEAIAA